MLARTYKTAEELDLTQDQYEVLFKVRDLLASGKIPHMSRPDVRLFRPYLHPEKRLFNMRFWVEPSECGTVCCIGGLAQEIFGVSFQFEDKHCDPNNLGLKQLFYPPYDLYQIGVDEAVKAIDTYLQTGMPEWDKASKRERI